MDLSPTDDQQAVIDLSMQIIGDRSTPDALRTLERDGITHDASLWDALLAADLVALALPEACGGGGYGLTEAAMVAEAVGAHAAMVPYVEVVASGRALAAAGDPLAAEVAGGAIVVPALREGPDARESADPYVTADQTDDGWVLSGDKRLASGATAATYLLVSARTSDGVALFAVDLGDVSTVDSTTLSGQVLRSVHLDRTPARRLDAADGLSALSTLNHELRVLRCAHLGGIASGALRLAADHCKERHQFGSPIGTFQAVAHRMADAWLDVNLIQATARQAAWRTDSDLPAVQAAASAAMWACEGSQRVVHAAQHVHGGIGVDIDYPVHRYFRWAKDLELQLGGASACTRDLGAAIAAEPLTIG
ncbi:acyl-CoA dehydrogenase family protein [Actinospongicola halichondriae]|uniref:acyl-CoA dehydrogenase family protein n=1 Tax=Actinospongicola halichondriae TaxID=3236844 RepID=UPI003D5A7D40